MRGWKDDEGKMDGQSLSSKHRVNMWNQASSSLRGVVEHSIDSSLTVVFRSIRTNKGTAREGGVLTKPSRDNSTVWKAGIMKTQTFKNNIKM